MKPFVSSLLAKIVNNMWDSQDQHVQHGDVEESMNIIWLLTRVEALPISYKFCQPIVYSSCFSCIARQLQLY